MFGCPNGQPATANREMMMKRAGNWSIYIYIIIYIYDSCNWIVVIGRFEWIYSLYPIGIVVMDSWMEWIVVMDSCHG